MSEKKYIQDKLGGGDFRISRRRGTKMCWVCLGMNVVAYLPPTTKQRLFMEPENTPLEKENIYKKKKKIGFQPLVLGGVIY